MNSSNFDKKNTLKFLRKHVKIRSNIANDERLIDDVRTSTSINCCINYRNKICDDRLIILSNN